MIHSSKNLKARDGEFEQFHYQLEDGERYQLTSDELDWLEFVRGRYAIYDHIDNNSQMIWDDVKQMDVYVYTMDTHGMSEALANDGIEYKAVCLSDDSALQTIFFYSNNN